MYFHYKNSTHPFWKQYCFQIFFAFFKPLFIKILDLLQVFSNLNFYKRQKEHENDSKNNNVILEIKEGFLLDKKCKFLYSVYN